MQEGPSCRAKLRCEYNPERTTSYKYKKTQETLLSSGNDQPYCHFLYFQQLLRLPRQRKGKLWELRQLAEIFDSSKTRTPRQQRRRFAFDWPALAPRSATRPGKTSKDKTKQPTDAIIPGRLSPATPRPPARPHDPSLACVHAYISNQQPSRSSPRSRP